jgi:hypothetical protein
MIVETLASPDQDETNAKSKIHHQEVLLKLQRGWNLFGNATKDTKKEMDLGEMAIGK